MTALSLTKDNLLFSLKSFYLCLFVIIKPLLIVLLYKGHVGTLVRGLGHLVNFRERSEILERDALNLCRKKMLEL